MSDRAKACHTAQELRREAVTFICSGKILETLEEGFTDTYLNNKMDIIDELRKQMGKILKDNAIRDLG